MKTIAYILVLFTGLPLGAACSLVQHPSNTACTAASTTCTITNTQNTGAGNLLVVTIILFDAGGPRTISGVSNIGSVVHCSNCAVQQSGNVDFSYVLSGTGGVASEVVTLNGNTSGGTWVAHMLEVSHTGAMSLDSGAAPSGNRNQSTSVTNPAGVSLTIAGANDCIVQAMAAGGTASAISAGWTADFPQGDGVGWKLNTNSGASPTWTQTSGTASLGGIAFTEALAAPKTFPVIE